MNRLDTLKGMLATNPSAEFVRYGLAQEYVKMGEDVLALKEFGQILQDNANYVAAYYHAGKALERLDRLEEARNMYRRGIEASAQTGDLHARSELEAALSEVQV